MLRSMWEDAAGEWFVRVCMCLAFTRLKKNAADAKYAKG